MVGAERTVNWGGLHNARDLGGLPSRRGVTAFGRVFRSPRLDDLDSTAWGDLDRDGIRTIIDLRNDDEVAVLRLRPEHVNVVRAPIEDQTDADGGADGAVDEFAIDPTARRRGHGGRLVNACVDTLRADGFARAQWWVDSTDDVLRRFLLAAGWAPDGAHRELGLDESDAVRLKQIRLHSDIGPVDSAGG